MIEVEVRGVEGLALVARRCRQLGDRTVVKHLAKRIRAEVGPVRKAVRGVILARFPSRGGLARWVASAPIRASVRRSSTSAGVSLVSGRRSQGGRTDLKAMDRTGMTRAPFYGHRSAWHPVRVHAGFFTDTIATDHLEAFRSAVVRAVDDAVDEVLR